MPSEYLLLESGDHLLLESGDDLLLESSTVDQTVALPVIDDSTILGPTLSVAGVIALPLIDDAATLPPLVFEDKQIDLPLVDDAATFGPSVSGAIDLPVIDDAAMFGPTVVVEQTAALPLIDDAETFAPSFSQPLTLDLRFIDGGWPFAPTVLGTVTAGLSVWLVVDGDDDIQLEPVTTPTFRDPLDDIGSFTVTLANDDTDLAACDFDQVLRFEVDGRPVFAGVIRDRDIVHLAPGEEHDHVTALSGPGFLGIGARDVIYPSRGVDSLPIEEVRSFSWVAPDFDSSSWPFAKKINLQRSYAFFEGAFVGAAGPVPHIWPDTTGWWIWADRADCTHLNAPPGTCLFRKGLTLAAAKRVRIFTAFDNAGRLYVDGAEVADFIGFTNGEYVELDLDAGSHVIAAIVTNAGADGDYNPGGFICAVYAVDPSGLLGSQIVHTDATWRCLPYVDNPPGFTPGEVLYALRDETDIYDGVGFSFTGTLDAEGEPWTEFSEITVQVGRTHIEVQREMAGHIIDIAAAPGAPIIRAWRKGTRGRTRSAVLTQTVGDPDASEFLQLRHTGHWTRMNRALIRYAYGWTEETIGAGDVGGFLELGHIRSKAEAQRIARKVMERRSTEAYTSQARLLPSADGPRPYIDFGVGDHITALDETGALTSKRVVGITLDPDEVGVLEWGVELSDIELELEELHQNWLRRAADGNGVGGARVTGPAGTPAPTAQRVVALDVAEFSMHDTDGGLPTGWGIARRAVKSGNAVEIAVTLTLVDDGVPTSSATVVSVYLNGALLGTVTVPAGATEAETALNIEAIRANVDRLRPNLVAVASQVAGVDIVVKAI